jgi:DNA polymerase III epsilon subunit-like protein
MKLLFTDTETGGQDPHKHSILSLGAVQWEDGVIKDELELFIKEDPWCVQQEALAVNGIDLREGEWDEPYSALQTFHNFSLHYQQLAGYKVPFDVGFISRLERLGNQGQEKKLKLNFNHGVFDIYTLALEKIIRKRLFLSHISLQGLCDHFGISFKNHGALSDARASALACNYLLDI